MERSAREENHQDNSQLYRQPGAVVRWFKAPEETTTEEQQWRLDPQTFKIEQQKAPAGCRAAEGVLCEHCLSQMVLSQNPLMNNIQDAFVAVSQFLLSAYGSITEALTSPINLLKKSLVKPLAERKIRTHTHKPGQHLCEQCMSEFHSSGTMWLDEAKEYSYIAGRGLLVVFECIGIFIIGIVMLIVTVFPHVVRAKTPEEREAEALQAAARDADFARKKQDQLDWEDGQKEEFAARKREIEKQKDADDQMKKHNETVTNINNALPGNKIIDVGSDVLADDQKVKELNATMRAVEDGKEDPAKLRKLADDLLSQRQEKAQKDARRYELDDQVRENDRKARQLAEDAERKARAAKRDEAEELARRSDDAWRKAQADHDKYRKV